MPSTLSTFSTSLIKIVKDSIGRGAQLKPGPGNNQYARASDFNGGVDSIATSVNAINTYINTNLNSANKSATVTQGGSAITTAVTTTGVIGAIKLYNGTITNSATSGQAFTWTNSNLTDNSIVLFTLTNRGDIAAGSTPFVASCVVTSGGGSATVTLGNGSSVATGTGTNGPTFSYVIL